MKALRTLLLLACTGMLVGSTMAFADEKLDDAPPGPDAGPNCDVTGYKTERIVYSTPVPIPDNNAAGVTLGPIFMPADGDLVNDVILELSATHTWVGDIIMELIYDTDCEGPLAGIPVRVLCRARGTAAAPPAPCGAGTTFGCSGDLVSTATYLFSDDAANQLGVGPLCTSSIAGGCYKPTDIPAGGSFATWRGLAKGGCWYLRVSDNAGLDLGTIRGWAVYVRNQRPVPVAETSWGKVKGTYR
jgi:hypothetical protein